jgi:hypothetical protein
VGKLAELGQLEQLAKLEQLGKLVELEQLAEFLVAIAEPNLCAISSRNRFNF